LKINTNDQASILLKDLTDYAREEKIEEQQCAITKTSHVAMGSLYQLVCIKLRINSAKLQRTA